MQRRGRSAGSLIFIGSFPQRKSSGSQSFYLTNYILLDILEYVYDRLHFSPSLALLLPLGSPSRPAQGRFARSRRSALGRPRSGRVSPPLFGRTQPAFHT